MKLDSKNNNIITVRLTRNESLKHWGMRIVSLLEKEAYLAESGLSSIGNCKLGQVTIQVVNGDLKYIWRVGPANIGYSTVSIEANS